MIAGTSPVGAGRTALRLRAFGLVQGVGFRPSVYRLASGLGLAGWVRNTDAGVEIEVEGAAEAVESFVDRLPTLLPPLARLDRLERQLAAPEGLTGFTIRESANVTAARQPVSPDVALCAACAAEQADPTDRRHRYPFITCTDCGPRYTVIEAMPYDRERTSMRAFASCAACAAEYVDPTSRRFHSETNSCHTCGPRLWFEDAAGRGFDGAVDDVLARAVSILRAGWVLAVRGLGGFHLAVDATSDSAVARLRLRKRREAKPLAIMVRTIEDARAIADVTPAEATLLTSAAAPIVLVTPRPGAALAPGLAPGLGQVGLMLAYTPLHRLLLEEAERPLVMTSGNASDEPIATGLDEARRRLHGIADGFLLHDREIVARYDDSVLRMAGDAPVFLRRARGYAPLPLALPLPTPMPLLAVGPHLKNTFTLADGSDAYVSQHIGDLETLESLAHFRDALARLGALFRLVPHAVVRDLHPGYLSSRLAEDLGLEPMLSVQHHHAHIAAVLAEHGRRDQVVGLAFDGTGWGTDGTVWGGEVLVADLQGFRRVGWLRPAPLPGGDLAARRPWRAALGYLSLEPDLAPAFALALDGVDPREREVAERQVARAINAPLASSMGRLFDAAAAVIGLRKECRYEGQAAMELEALAGDAEGLPLSLPVHEAAGAPVLDPLPLLAAMGEAALDGADPERLAAGFHDALAAAAVEAAARVARRDGIGTVALGGGVFQNARLLVSVERGIRARGLEVLRPRLLGPNDGAISYGQAAVGAARLAAGAPLSMRGS